MNIKVENPSNILVGIAYQIYNSTKASDLPDVSGTSFGIDDNVWTNLIDLTREKCKTINPSMFPARNDSLGGACIYASVVATKFFAHKNSQFNSHVVRIYSDSGKDHYFVVASDGSKDKIICDITTNQFTAAPNYIVGRLSTIKGQAKKYDFSTDGSKKLYDAYALGAGASTFVI